MPRLDPINIDAKNIKVQTGVVSATHGAVSANVRSGTHQLLNVTLGVSSEKKEQPVATEGTQKSSQPSSSVMQAKEDENARKISGRNLKLNDIKHSGSIVINATGKNFSGGDIVSEEGDVCLTFNCQYRP
jgi:hypothetical protein